MNLVEPTTLKMAESEKKIYAFQCTFCFEQFEIGLNLEYRLLSHYYDMHAEDKRELEVEIVKTEPSEGEITIQEQYLIEAQEKETENEASSLKLHEEKTTSTNSNNVIAESTNCEFVSIPVTNLIKSEPISETSFIESETMQEANWIEAEISQGYEITEVSLSSGYRRTKTRKRYECPVCFKEFISSSRLKEHKLYHYPKKYNCKMCSKGFYRPRDLRYHMKYHEEGIANQEGRKPKKVKPDKSYYYGHKNSGDSLKPWKCISCVKTFTAQRSVKRHYNKMHKVDDEDIQNYTSETFNSNNASEFGLERVDETIIQDYAEEPNESEIGIDDTNLLPSAELDYTVEESNIQNDTDAFELKYKVEEPTIQNETATEIECKVEETINETEEEEPQPPAVNEMVITKFNWKKYECSICSKVCNTSSHLKEHQLYHYAPQYCCKICSKKFYRPRDLRYHQAKGHDYMTTEDNVADNQQTSSPVDNIDNTDQQPASAVKLEVEESNFYGHPNSGDLLKPWRCLNCERLFSTQSAVKNHYTRMHNKSNKQKRNRNRAWSGSNNCTPKVKKTYQCSLCSKLCTSSSRLKEHEAYHYAPEYNCEICGKKFFRARNLRYHLDSHAGIGRKKIGRKAAANM